MLRRLVAERQIKLGAYPQMKKHIENYDVFKETISENNVLAMAEQLVMYETRFLMDTWAAECKRCIQTYALI